MKKLALALGIVFGVVLATAAALYGIGLALPEGHTATVRAELDASPPRVWRVLSDYETWPEWNPGVASVEVDEGDPLRLVTAGAWGGKVTWEIVETYPPERLRLRVADPHAPYGGMWTWRIEPTDAGSRITLTEDGEVYNPLYRAISFYVIGYTANLRDALQGLAGHLDEEVRIHAITGE